MATVQDDHPASTTTQVTELKLSPNLDNKWIYLTSERHVPNTNPINPEKYEIDTLFGSLFFLKGGKSGGRQLWILDPKVTFSLYPIQETGTIPTTDRLVLSGRQPGDL